jgi:hypothetical protein
MRALILTLAALASACDTRIVELFPEDASLPDAPAPDAQIMDATLADALIPDATTPDAPAEDALVEDAAALDALPLDAQADASVACVCTLPCRIPSDCATLGAGAMCLRGLCFGGTTCRTNVDCPASATCVQSGDMSATCP